METITNRVKNWLKGVGFNRLLISLVCIGILLVSLLTTLVSSTIIGNDLRDRIEQEGINLIETFVESARLSLLYQSEEESKNAVAGILTFPDIEAAAVYINDANHKSLYRSGSIPDIPGTTWPDYPTLQYQDNLVWVYTAPVYSSNSSNWANPFTDPIEPELLGYVRIVQSKAALNKMLSNIYLINLVVSLAGAAVLLLLLSFVTNRVTKPIQNLARIMRRAEQGEKDIRAKLEGTREIVDMETAFNTMMAVLNERERELKSARDLALEAARVKGEFAANVSHELRTPMNGVLGMLELIKDLGLPPKQEEYIEIATSSAETLLALIDDILDFSKTDAGKISLEQSTFNINDLLEEITTLLSIQAHKKNLQLVFFVDDNVPENIQGDAGRLRQVLVNLMANGIKFTDWGEVTIKVSLDESRTNTSDAQDLALKFTVTDTGIGIRPKAQETIFDAFSQVDSSTKKRYGGTGLGLAISQQLVKLMGGEIGVKSIVGKGSQFWFTALLKPTREDSVTIIPDIENVDMLVVDDNISGRRFTLQQLHRIGIEAKAANSGSTALDLLRSAAGLDIKLVIVDENINGIRVNELAQVLASEDSLSGIQLLVQVNRHSPITEQYLAANISGFLQKPVKRDALRRTLETVLHSSPTLPLPGKAEATNSGPSFAGARILVVEDNRSNQKVAIGMLERLGCKATIANNGREAVETLLRDDFDLVLMDCHMPEMDGYETTAQIRVFSSEKSRIPIVAMTANVQQGEHEKCLAVGMDDFIPKPLKMNTLRGVLERWTQSKLFQLADSDRSPLANTIQSPTGAYKNVLDESTLSELEGSIGESLNHMLLCALEDLPDYLEQLHRAVSADDPESWAEVAHAIKGTSLNVGAKKLHTLSETMEAKGRAADHDGIGELLGHIDAELERACIALSQLCAARGVSDYEAQPSPPTEPGHVAARVLVVDDDKGLRRAIAEAIESTGNRVDEVANGEQAIMYCERFMPDLILMDAVMPEMDGLQACQRILRMPGGESVTIIICTGLNDEASISRAFAAGAMDYIAKPINFAVLKKRVVRLLQAKQAESHVRQLAYNDVLTGLPNRKHFTDKLAEYVSRPSLNSGLVAILFLDLDRFKLINDTFGHDSGDLLLKVVAERLVGCVRQGDIVSRFGGDEFVVMLRNIKSYSAIEGIAAKIQQALARPFVFLGKELRITTSIGIATYPDNGDDINILLKNADLAMYRAKRRGNSYEFFESRMEEESSRRLALENDLRGAIERGEMRLFYQPQVDVNSGELVGAEALIRWQHPSNGFVNPLEFIALAEETGQIYEIGEWVLNTACQQLKQWHLQGFTQMRVAVNISGRQLDRGDLHEVVAEILDKVKLPPASLELEITESTIMENAERVIDTLQTLKSMGVSLAIDDFGTGYSSLSYLRRFPIDLLKVDREFVRDVDVDKVDADIVNAIITLAHALDVKVIAEGVETEAQHQFLRNQGCDFLQGYLYGKPIPSDEFSQQLESGKCYLID